MTRTRPLGRIALCAALTFAVGCGSSGTTTSTTSPRDTGNGTDGSSSLDAGSEDDGGDPADTGSDLWADGDGDGSLDRFDNCPETPNSEQKDTDGDGVGDECDNHLECANRNQDDGPCEDESYDYEKDSDGDGTPDTQDVCPDTADSDQADSDSDGVGDACDNCPDVSNELQENSDDDDTGDACEEEPAGDICSRKSANFQRVDPNIYMVIDRSSSMSNDDGTGKSRLKRAKEGLDRVADDLHDEIRVGMSTYPCANESDPCSKVNKQFLSMGGYSKSEIRDAYRSNFDDSTCPHGDDIGLSGLDIEVGGKHKTETGAALEDVRTNNRLSDPNDSLDSERTKRVVLITDGNACGCGDGGCGSGQQKAKMELNALKNSGIKTFVVGFNFSSSLLNEAARVGGTDAGSSGKPYFYSASNASQLVNALKKIADKTISCSFEIQEATSDFDPNKMWVKVHGTTLSEGDYTYDASNKTVSLDSQACKDLRNNSSSKPLEIVLGCPGECEASEEVCDYRDNNCDGDVDEGCEGCEPERCNSKDDDCDGETDEGCCTEKANGETCSKDSECCSGWCREDGTCGKPCRPLDVSCTEDSQCCSTRCGANGKCITG